MIRSAAEIERLFAYNRWANARSFEAASALSPEELGREVGGSFASVLGTLTHLVGAEWVWLERWHGRSPRALPQSFAGLAELRSRLAEVEAGQERLLSEMTSERLAGEISYINFKGERFTYPLADTLVHVVNHGTYHRGQVTTLLRQLGSSPLATDFLVFLDGKRG